VLSDGWQAAASAPGNHADASGLGGLAWADVDIPGRGNDAHRADASPDDRDWWFRVGFELAAPSATEQIVLVFEGLATVAEVYLNGELILQSDSMFAASAVDVGAFVGHDNELVICCRALTPLLAVRRKPRARWRTRLVANGTLRFVRTMLIGRAPGFAPGPAVVGPWRPVRLERRRGLRVSELELRPRVIEDRGVLEVRARLQTLGASLPEEVTIELTGPDGTQSAMLEVTHDGENVTAQGALVVPGVALWWPHTHGEPALYGVALIASGPHERVSVDCGRVGFRTLSANENLEADGLALRVNGVAVFARGALWTPLEASGLEPSPRRLRTLLEAMCAAGMNMVRIPGTGAYESRVFHDLCDELGLLVWQDFMFANMDYPDSDAEFLDIVRREVSQVLAELGGRPSLAVLCGSSEISQQVAMLGLDPGLVDGPLFGELLPDLVREASLDAVYVPSAPWGGALPFRPDRGVANYYGVGGYRRPIEDVRRAGVRFAAECLAFANIPDQAALDDVADGLPGGITVHHPRWKAGVPRDSGTGWDFDDVRDHYLASVFGLDPGELRRSDHDRYLELSRAVTGEVMAEVFGEWRRGGSPCAGGLVLWLRDLQAGAGWGVLDYRGRPKVAYHHLRRALAPLAVWSTDEGLSGIAVHVANDRPSALTARLRVALCRDFETPVEQVTQPLELAPHTTAEYNVEDLLGHFVDVSWAYRFGPPGQDVVVCSLERAVSENREPLSQSFRFPVGRPLARESSAHLGLEATLSEVDHDTAELLLRTRRLAYGVRIAMPGFEPADDAFCLEPGGERQITLRRISDERAAADAGTLTALNLSGRAAIVSEALL